MKSSYILGLFYIVSVSIIWAAASILVQYLYQGLDFDSPFLLTYIGTSLFIILLPLYFIYERYDLIVNGCYRFWCCCCISISDSSKGGAGAGDTSTSTGGSWCCLGGNKKGQDIRDYNTIDANISSEGTPLSTNAELNQSEEEESDDSDNDNDDIFVDYDGNDDDVVTNGKALSTQEYNQKHNDSVGHNQLLTHKEHIIMAIKIAPWWFISNYFYNLSLKYTTITSSTVLSSTASVFTFLFALLWGEETFNRWKLLGVIMAFSGSALTSIHDADNSDNGGDIMDDEPFQSQLWGDGAGLISAVGYGVYSVLLRLLCHDESRISMNLFLGYIGLFNMITLSPFLIWSFRDAFHDDSDVDYYYEGNDNDNDRHEYVLRYLSSQNLSWFIFFCLIVKGLFDNVLSDFLWAKSILLTSATVATVGLGLTIPLALLSDLFIMDRSDVLSVESLTGAMLVLLGFIFVNIGENGKDDHNSSIDDKLDFEAISLQVQIS